MSRLEFWYDFASSYSYLTAMRIAPMAAAAGIDVVYRPFLLGPIFRAQGLTTSPFVLNPTKGQYMVRDITRTAERRGQTFQLPKVFPAHSVLAARIGLIAEDEGWIAGYTHAVFAAGFAEGADIASPETLAQVVAGLGQDPGRVIGLANSEDNKSRLRSRTDEAISKGVFGAPMLICPDGEQFWGDDRLEAALAWTSARAE